MTWQGDRMVLEILRCSRNKEETAGGFWELSFEPDSEE